MSIVPTLTIIVLILLAIVFPPLPVGAADWRPVTDDRLLNAESDGANWLMYNRTYNGWRYSPLAQINAGTIKRLVPKWIFAGGALGEQQMTPVVNDGVMFTTSTALGWNRVHALRARTGAPTTRPRTCATPALATRRPGSPACAAATASPRGRPSRSTSRPGR